MDPANQSWAKFTGSYVPDLTVRYRFTGGLLIWLMSRLEIY